MNNKVNVANPKYRILKFVILLLLLPAIMAMVVLFTNRALDTRNYNGNVKTVSGIVVNVEDDDGDIKITLDNNVIYNANAIKNYPNVDLFSLQNQEVTFYLPQKQVGSKTLPWIIGLEQNDNTLVDYNEVIANGKAEAKQAMIICGVIAGVLVATAVGVYFVRMRINPVKEEYLYKQFCQICIQRQPNCPEYKYLGIALVVYLIISLIAVFVISIVGSTVENPAIVIPVAVVFGLIFVCSSVAFLLLPHWLLKKERKFYIEKYPFDLTDISHVIVPRRQKQHKAELQAELIERRQKFPHRYFDAGNGYEVDFTENGVEFFEEDESFPTPDTVFELESDISAQKPHSAVHKLTYQQLNLEALPYYRKKDHPLTVVIKSRIEDKNNLPEEMANDLHFMLDSNLLETLHHFNAQVENLQNILDNKATLIKENCGRHKKQNQK